MQHVIVVHGNDGLDEISITDDSSVSELKDGEIKNYEISPKDFGQNLWAISHSSLFLHLSVR